MTPEYVRDVMAILLFVVLIARAVVLLGYEQRSSRLWTAGLPTVALAALVGRVVIARQFDITLQNDWLAAGLWTGNVAAQSIAVIYGYWPTHLVRTQRGV